MGATISSFDGSQKPSEEADVVTPAEAPVPAEEQPAKQEDVFVNAAPSKVDTEEIAALFQSDGRSSKKTTIDSLPDEVLIKVLAAVSSSAESPAEVVAPAMTCKRWNSASKERCVRRRTSRGGVSVKTHQWGLGAFSFLRKLCDSGSLEACFFLGMILFYCVPEAQVQGTHLLLHSARYGHASALHTASLLMSNGALLGPHSKDAKLGVSLCARAAAMGHVDALRELGHCLMDGYGVKQNALQGWRMLLEAQSLETLIKGTTSSSGKRPFPSPAESEFEADTPSSFHAPKKARVDAFGNSAAMSAPQQEAQLRRLLQRNRPLPMDVTQVQAVLFDAKKQASPPARIAQPKASPPQSSHEGPELDAASAKALSLILAGSSHVSEEQLRALRPLQSLLQTSSLEAETHPAMEFVQTWFASAAARVEEKLSAATVQEDEEAMAVLAAPGFCSRQACLRPEKQSMEYLRCSQCWRARYCSRSCQVHDWQEGHQEGCAGHSRRSATTVEADSLQGHLVA